MHTGSLPELCVSDWGGHVYNAWMDEQISTGTDCLYVAVSPKTQSMQGLNTS